ncbi:MAG: hypothetical protein ACOC3V_00675 [bacterium]
MDNFLYHITKLKYLDNILINGLLINSNKNGLVKKSYLKKYYTKYGLQPIFLTNDVNYIIKTQLTDDFIKDSCILKINTSTLMLEDEFDYLNNKWYLYYNTKDDMIENISKYVGKSFICRENIKPNLICETRRFN